MKKNKRYRKSASAFILEDLEQRLQNEHLLSIIVLCLSLKGFDSFFSIFIYFWSVEP